MALRPSSSLAFFNSSVSLFLFFFSRTPFLRILSNVSLRFACSLLFSTHKNSSLQSKLNSCGDTMSAGDGTTKKAEMEDDSASEVDHLLYENDDRNCNSECHKDRVLDLSYPVASPRPQCLPAGHWRGLYNEDSPLRSEFTPPPHGEPRCDRSRLQREREREAASFVLLPCCTPRSRTLKGRENFFSKKRMKQKRIETP